VCEKDAAQENACQVLVTVDGATTETMMPNGSLLKYLEEEASFFVMASVPSGDTEQTSELSYSTSTSDLLEYQQYLKASNAGEDDNFGAELALSGDGRVLAVGVLYEDSGDVTTPEDDEKSYSGAVYIYRDLENNGRWTQTAYLKATTPVDNDYFGRSVSISQDGHRLAVGADTSVTVLDYDETTERWSESYVVTGGLFSSFGIDVALSAADGKTLVVGASHESKAYVYQELETGWEEKAQLTIESLDTNDSFGNNLMVSGDGSVIAIAALGESSGVVGDREDNSAPESGAIYTFRYNEAQATWLEDSSSYLKLHKDEVVYEGCGFSVRGLSLDGSVMAASCAPYSDHAVMVVYRYNSALARWEESAPLSDEYTAGTGLALSGDGHTIAYNIINYPVFNQGSVLMYRYDAINDMWNERAVMTVANGDDSDYFGFAISLSVDGNTLAAGAPLEDASADGGPTNNDELDSGAVYVF
ncbi:hypothetical protein, partial [Vibrio amylolyticus]